MNMNDGKNSTALCLHDHRQIEPMSRIGEIRDELEWYLRGHVPSNDVPRIDRATDALVGVTPLDDAIDALHATLDETTSEDLPEGYSELFMRTLRLLVSLDDYERWVRLYESAHPPSGDLLRITAYPMTESTTVVLSAKYLFGEYFPAVVYDVSTPHSVEAECEQKARGFARVEFRPDRRGNVSFAPRFGPATDTGTHAIHFFEERETAFGSTHGTPSTGEANGIPAAVTEVSVPTLPTPADGVEDHLAPRGIEADPAMMLRRTETAQAMTDPIYAIAPGMYRVGYEMDDDRGNIVTPEGDLGEVASSTSDTPALGPGADVPQVETEYVVNINPTADSGAAEEGDESPAEGGDGFDHGDEAAACLCDDFVYRGAPGNIDCKHILAVKRLINAGLLPPPDASPEAWLDDRLDECEAIIDEYAREDRADEMRFTGTVSLDPDGDETETPAQQVRRARRTLLAAVGQARKAPEATDFRMLVAEIARIVAPPIEAWPVVHVGGVSPD